MNIVIIGATSGIGKALFEKYANENNRIGIIGRRAHLVDELYHKYPSKAIPAKADITNLEEIGQAICTLHETLGHIDLAIACAGTGEINATLDYAVERPTIDTNVVPMAPAYSATKAYQINYMEALRKKAFKNGGHIIVTDIRPGLVDTAMAKGEGLFWVMTVDKVASQIIAAIRKKKSKAYVTRRWHILAIINKNLPFFLYKRM